MTAAALLAAYGVRVVVLEREARTSEEPKAISIDDESLRVCQWAGMVERILRIIVPGTGTRYYDASGQAVFQARAAQARRFGYPFKNPFAQPELESELAQHLDEHPNVDLRMGTEVTRVAEHGARVEVRTAAGVLRARYVLGCDGGRSTVREHLGVGMTGRSYDDVWLVADVLGDHHDQRYGMHHGDPRRPHVIIPGRDGRCRYEFLLWPEEGQAGAPPGFDLIRRLLSPYRDITPGQVERAVNYRFNAVLADRWRVGRVFLLGDAAHMMPPFAGQGLNSGIRDAANIAWKIADVIAGRLEESALDSYELERRPHAEATVRLSDKLRRVVMTTNDRVARHRDRLIGQALASEGGRTYFEEMRFRPSHSYADGLLDVSSPNVGVPVGQPVVFDTGSHGIVLLDEALGTGWALLGVGVDSGDLRRAGKALAALAPVLACVAVDERLPAGGDVRGLIDVDGRLDAEFASFHGQLVLLRPDRFVAAAWAPTRSPDLTDALCLRVRSRDLTSL
jgi:3-(3-hydroxy-phenyl)propionate hydroxylase